jgi:lipocalin
MEKLNLGILCMTDEIICTMGANKQFTKEITAALQRYYSGDWGDMCREDKKLNDNAVKSGEDRIVAAYETSESKIYIITEWDRSYTTILFASEY